MMSNHTAAHRNRRVRPLFWRLPLILLLVVGFATLIRLDSLLVRDYRKDAASQALQIDALLESFIQQRVALLGSMRAMAASWMSPSRRYQGFDALVRQLTADAPDVFAVHLLDDSGDVLAVMWRAGIDPERISPNHLDILERAPALRRAIAQRRVALTGPLRLRDGQRGMIVYVPVVRDSVVTVVIGGAVEYQSLFNDALAGQLRGRFAYRIRDESGALIAITSTYPSRPASLITRRVDLADARRWALDVAVPPFQPFMPRLITWLAGVVFLLLITAIVLREEARARRFAAHSHDLEMLSRDLLDANIRLEERSQQIAEANRAKSRFLANVSHELRTPLNAIVGYNSLALDGVYGEMPHGQRHAHDRIRAAGEHLLGLVNDVLDLSKIEVGRMEVAVEPVELETIVDSVVTVIEPIVEAKGVRLDVFVSHGLPTILSDPHHLRQIVMNLMSNAIKFTDKGAVTLIVRRSPELPDDRVELVVQDSGIGIPESELSRIFEEFEQVRPSSRGDSMQRGTGLGLAIARKLARLLGGDVAVDSRLGKGSRFVLDLPIRGGVRMAARPEAVAADREKAAGDEGERGEESGEKVTIGGEDTPPRGLDVTSRYE